MCEFMTHLYFLLSWHKICLLRLSLKNIDDSSKKEVGDDSKQKLSDI